MSSKASNFSNSSNPQNGKKPKSWIELYFPETIRPYAYLARLDKPIGSWLFGWPAFWSVALAAKPGSLPDLKMLLVFAWWTVFIRGAACTINDFFDREFDRKVERTKTRPLASGAVSPVKGLLWFFVQTLAALVVLYPVNHVTFTWAVLHLPSVVAYPLMKRITYWPQAFLGLMINWGILLGLAATRGSIDSHVAFPLCVSSFFWTLVYDTIYAHQDKQDDVSAGVKSTALLLGDSTKEWCVGFSIACIGGLAVAGIYADMGLPYFTSLGAASGHLAWQVFTADLSSPADCLSKFVSNKTFGAIVFSACVLGRLFAW